jgi:hypothetical protein
MKLLWSHITSVLCNCMLSFHLVKYPGMAVLGQMEDVLVCQSPTAEWLKTTEMYCLTVLEPEVQNPGVSRTMLPLEPREVPSPASSSPIPSCWLVAA